MHSVSLLTTVLFSESRGIFLWPTSYVGQEWVGRLQKFKHILQKQEIFQERRFCYDFFFREGNDT